MKIILFIMCALCFQFGSATQKHKTNKDISMFVDTDYRPLHKAYQRVKIIQEDYATFKDQVTKNTTLEYAKCLDAVEVQQCKYYDEWIYRIDLLKIENAKSKELEIPFLLQKKHEKVERLKFLLKDSEFYDKTLLQMSEQLKANQKELNEDSRQIEAMYKLPKEKQQTQLIQEQQNAKDSSDVPDVAKQQLQQAREQYEIADQSIQAQTAKNVLSSDSSKLTETIAHLKHAFAVKVEQMNKEKHQLKEDILRLRTLLANEQALQQKNNATILELQGKVEGCKGKPTNVKKDCDPIFLHAKKYKTEVEIVSQRNMLLFKELDLLAWENNFSPLDEIQHDDSLRAKEADEFRLLAEEESQNQTVETTTYQEPQEKYPIKHLEPIEEPKEEAAEQPTEETTEETPEIPEVPGEGETPDVPETEDNETIEDNSTGTP